MTDIPHPAPSFPEREWSIPGSMATLPAASRDVFDWLDSLPLSSRAKYVGRLAVEEVAGNALKYGFPPGGAHAVHLRIVLGPEYLRLDFTDDGRAFDPTSRPPADLEDVLANVSEGGLGLTLLSRVCAKMEYRRDGPLNRLTLHVRKFEPGDTQPIGLPDPPPPPPNPQGATP